MARLVFFEQAWRDLYDDWGSKADDVVSYLRFQAGRNLDDPDLMAPPGSASEANLRVLASWYADSESSATAVRTVPHPSVIA